MNRTQALCVELGQLDHKEAAECGPLMWSTDEEGTPRNRCVCVCVYPCTFVPDLGGGRYHGVRGAGETTVGQEVLASIL